MPSTVRPSCAVVLALTSRSSPPRRRPSRSVDPAGFAVIAARSASLDDTAVPSTERMTSPAFSTDAAGAPAATSATATVSGTVTPASRSPATEALVCESVISWVFSDCTCCSVCPGGKTCSTGSTARLRDTQPCSTSRSVTLCPGPPKTSTVVMSSVPFAG
ncbi:hypothetical protein GCM10025868_37610 [Angustibacter aerolatus]|uniref:Uncharacterized protein n=1 Tax=Angustibacter aerolatus TaxID=1162965 RepID=A0ABQ6JJT1_9ACTN|nr:hypothetical protein GCM10025868_37610 [Angustibacter aerolatus]